MAIMSGNTDGTFDSLEKDYGDIREISLKALQRDEGVVPIRCHEMAFLFYVGFRQKGYDCRIEDGLYTGGLYGGYFEHSWVRIYSRPQWFIRKNAIAHHVFGPYASLFGELRLSRGELVRDWRGKRNFRRRKLSIQYKLAYDIEALANEAFGIQDGCLL